MGRLGRENETKGIRIAVEVFLHILAMVFVGIVLIFIITCNAVVSAAKRRRRKKWEQGVRGVDED